MAKRRQTQIPGYEGYVSDWSNGVLDESGTTLVRSIQRVINEACTNLDMVSTYDDANKLASTIMEAVEQYREHIKNYPDF
jgi:hypothetical protein